MNLRKIIKKLNYLSLLHRIHIQRVAAKQDVYLGQPAILDYISTHDRCTQKEVAEWMQVSPPSIATSVKRMQKSGLLKKEQDAEDLRITRLSLTESGRERFRRCRLDCDTVDDSMFRGFRQEELETLEGYLDRLVENLASGDLRGKSFFALIEAEREGKEKRHD